MLGMTGYFGGKGKMRRATEAKSFCIWIVIMTQRDRRRVNLLMIISISSCYGVAVFMGDIEVSGRC